MKNTSELGKSRTCKNCTYWNPNGGGDPDLFTKSDEDAVVGTCHIKTPNPAPTSREDFTWWPVTSSDDWCGAHKPDVPIPMHEILMDYLPADASEAKEVGVSRIGARVEKDHPQLAGTPAYIYSRALDRLCEDGIAVKEGRKYFRRPKDYKPPEERGAEARANAPGRRKIDAAEKILPLFPTRAEDAVKISQVKERAKTEAGVGHWPFYQARKKLVDERKIVKTPGGLYYRPAPAAPRASPETAELLKSMEKNPKIWEVLFQFGCLSLPGTITREDIEMTGGGRTWRGATVAILYMGDAADPEKVREWAGRWIAAGWLVDHGERGIWPTLEGLRAYHDHCPDSEGGDYPAINYDPHAPDLRCGDWLLFTSGAAGDENRETWKRLFPSLPIPTEPTESEPETDDLPDL